VREATTNVLRHSRARQCEIAVRRSGHLAVLEVRDDGVGPLRSLERGSGLRGLGERMAEAGGALETGATPDGGFRLIATVPVSPRGREARADRQGLLTAR
jgi:two-component system sensor histidine kinase DesK